MSHWRALNPTLRGILIMVLVGAVIVGAGWWYDSRGRVEMGPVETTAEVSGQPLSTASFKIPDGSVDVEVQVGDATLSTDDNGKDVGPIRAPRGGRLIEVSWSGREAGIPPDEPAPDHPASSLSLRAGDRTYDLADSVELEDTSSDDEEFAVVAVPKDEPLVAVLEFAGKKQSIDLETGRRTMGAFASLYRSGPMTVERPSSQNHRGSDGMSWFAHLSAGNIRRSPYLAGRGWAKPGREWVRVTDLKLTADDFGRYQDDDIQSYDPAPAKGIRASLTINGERPVGGATSSGVDDDFGDVEYAPGESVFDVERGSELAVTATVRVPLKGGGSEAPPPKEPVVVSMTATVDAALEPGADR